MSKSWAQWAIAVVALGCALVVNVPAGAAPTVRIKQVFRNGPFLVKVTGYKCGITYVGTSLLGKSPVGQYCRVSFMYQNATKSPQFSPGYYTAKDVHGRTFASDNIADIYGNDINNASIQINPGYGNREKAFFDIPKSDSLKGFTFHYEYGSAGVFVSL
jgi:hypothetical protein